MNDQELSLLLDRCHNGYAPTEDEALGLAVALAKEQASLLEMKADRDRIAGELKTARADLDSKTKQLRDLAEKRRLWNRKKARRIARDLVACDPKGKLDEPECNAAAAE